MTEDDLQVAALARAVGQPVFRQAPAQPSVPRNQPRPVYDEATDGNRFAWILNAARAVRIQEQAANEVRRIRLQASRRAAMPVLIAREAK
jgi:hypothetical protein